MQCDGWGGATVLSAGRRAGAVAAMMAMSATASLAQSMDDAIFMDRRVLCAGLVFTRDQWTQYWEGTLRRDNGNIGTLTTQQATVMAAYGITNRVNILASVPYVWTNASQGVLQGQRGAQDLSVAVKVNALTTPLTSVGTLHVIGVAALTAPTTGYTPDFMPLSIGSNSRRGTVRGLLSFQARRGWYVNGALGYTLRANVTLDRPAYFTNNQLFLSNEVQLPDVRDAAVTVGYQRRGLVVPITLVQQRTLGGGDIRRQDMPFVSNRMDFTRLDTRVQYTLPKLPGVIVHAGGSRVLAGRNVGQSTTIMAGVLLAGRL
jgi:hypothetical protein